MLLAVAQSWSLHVVHGAYLCKSCFRNRMVADVGMGKDPTGRRTRPRWWWWWWWRIIERTQKEPMPAPNYALANWCPTWGSVVEISFNKTVSLLYHCNLKATSTHPHSNFPLCIKPLKKICFFLFKATTSGPHQFYLPFKISPCRLILVACSIGKKQAKHTTSHQITWNFYLCRSHAFSAFIF